MVTLNWKNKKNPLLDKLETRNKSRDYHYQSLILLSLILISMLTIAIIMSELLIIYAKKRRQMFLGR